jgi:hypothetical protein
MTLVTKDCLHCYYTHPLIFDGMCPIVDELNSKWVEQEHPICWRPVPLKLWIKWFVETIKIHFARSKKHG